MSLGCGYTGALHLRIVISILYCPQGYEKQSYTLHKFELSILGKIPKYQFLLGCFLGDSFTDSTNLKNFSILTALNRQIGFVRTYLVIILYMYTHTCIIHYIYLYIYTFIQIPYLCINHTTLNLILAKTGAFYTWDKAKTM